ncbi:MAG TPA: hypothetical protein VEJ86_00935 [Candidatus Binataceae bacterium]|nr:hypothetical protein [Candidatus Binataceae bacterium]
MICGGQRIIVQFEQRIFRFTIGATTAAVAFGLVLAASPAQSAAVRNSVLRAEHRIAQDESSSEDAESNVPPAEVEKYIDVQKAMQQNHSLTVEQACTQRGLGLADFRQIEDRIERDDALRERVRKALRDAAASSSHGAN